MSNLRYEFLLEKCLRFFRALRQGNLLAILSVLLVFCVICVCIFLCVRSMRSDEISPANLVVMGDHVARIEADVALGQADSDESFPTFYNFYIRDEALYLHVEGKQMELVGSAAITPTSYWTLPVVDASSYNDVTLGKDIVLESEIMRVKGCDLEDVAKYVGYLGSEGYVAVVRAYFPSFIDYYFYNSLTERFYRLLVLDDLFLFGVATELPDISIYYGELLTK